MELAHTRTVEEVLQDLKVTEEEGLNNSRVEELRRKHGLNGKTSNIFLAEVEILQQWWY